MVPKKTNNKPTQCFQANELDALLGDLPVQHRETQGYESEQFHNCFPKGIRLLKGGIASGFRDVNVDEGNIEIPTRLFHVRKHGKNKVLSYLVPVSLTSLNQGDAFILDAGDTIYTWYGTSCNPFEKNKAVETAHNMVENRGGHCTLVSDVSDEDEAFLELLGGKRGDIIPEASSYTDDDMPVQHETKMFVVTDENMGKIKVQHVEPVKRYLISDGVCLIDIGDEVLVWIGKRSSTREQQQSMLLVQTHLKVFGREKNTQVVRIMEGQERRCLGWSKAFPH
jgi:Gelsolin repeat